MKARTLRLSVSDQEQDYFHAGLDVRDNVTGCAFNEGNVCGGEGVVVAASFQVIVDTLRRVDHSMQQGRMLSKIQNIDGARPNTEVVGKVLKGPAWSVRQTVSLNYFKDAVCLNEFCSQRYSEGFGALLHVEKLLSRKNLTGKALLLGMFLALFKKCGVRCGFLLRRADISSMLFDERDYKRNDGEACLSPSRPFALRDAERWVEQAAIVDRIGHVTSPVSMAAIVGGRGS